MVVVRSDMKLALRVRHTNPGRRCKIDKVPSIPNWSRSMSGITTGYPIQVVPFQYLNPRFGEVFEAAKKPPFRLPPRRNMIGTGD